MGELQLQGLKPKIGSATVVQTVDIGAVDALSSAIFIMCMKHWRRMLIFGGGRSGSGVQCEIHTV
jgi:hypothetical protein